MRKIGLLVMALVLALGTLGVGYASWTDTITIDGTVNTGSVDIEIVDYSNTIVWKIKPTEVGGTEIYVQETWDKPADGRVSDPDPASPVDAFPNANPPGTAGTDPVATADASAGATDDSIKITIDNAFPLDDLTADFLLHYAGTIPVKVTVSELGFTDLTDDPDANIKDYVTIKYFESDISGKKGNLIKIQVGDQWHYCEYILVEITVTLPQDNTLMSQTGTIKGKIEVKQWNKY